MAAYEGVFIVSPDLDEKQQEAIIESLGQTIAKHGGSVGEVQRWGRRRLGYHIRKKADGIYFLIQFNAEPLRIKEMERDYALNDGVWKAMIKRKD